MVLTGGVATTHGGTRAGESSSASDGRALHDLVLSLLQRAEVRLHPLEQFVIVKVLTGLEVREEQLIKLSATE